MDETGREPITREWWPRNQVTTKAFQERGSKMSWEFQEENWELTIGFCSVPGGHWWPCKSSLRRIVGLKTWLEWLQEKKGRDEEVIVNSTALLQSFSIKRTWKMGIGWGAVKSSSRWGGMQSSGRVRLIEERGHVSYYFSPTFQRESYESVSSFQNTLLCREHALGALLDAGDSDVIDMWASPAKSLQMEEKEADKLPITMGKLGNPEVSWVSCPCMLPLGFAFPFYSLLTTPLGFS